MRYVILNKNMSDEEISSRKKFIEKVTDLYFVPKMIEEGMEFVSIPSQSIDCIFIVGHNVNVSSYLQNNDIVESNLVVVSCAFNINKRIYTSKRIYVSFGNNGITDYFDGSEWNLNYNISKEELKIINSSGSFMERVENIFRRLN